MKEVLFSFFAIMVLITVSITLGWMLNDTYDLDFFNSNDQSIQASEEEIIQQCSNISLKETAKCLKNNIKTFYYYNVTNELYSDVETIRKFGGDCYNYAMLYIKLAKELGFDSDYRRYNGEEGIFPGHRVAFMWDNETYCLLDQLNVYCDNEKQ